MNKGITMVCKHCGKPIVLSPSAQDRADKDITGRSASYYRSLFEYCIDCTIKLRLLSADKSINFFHQRS